MRFLKPEVYRFFRDVLDARSIRFIPIVSGRWSASRGRGW
jgi:hypothetical protein